MQTNPQFPADLVPFTEEILNGKLHFLCSELHLVCKKISGDSYHSSTLIFQYFILSAVSMKVLLYWFWFEYTVFN